MVYQPPPGRPVLRFGSGWTPVVKWFVIACAGAYVLEVFSPEVVAYLGLTPALVWTRGWAWQLVTFNFLHDPHGLGHIVFNLLSIYMFAPELERVYGTRRFLLFMAISGIGSGACVALADRLAAAPTIGCSGIVFAVLLVYAVLYPDRQVLLFFVIPIRIKWLMIGLGVIGMFYFVGGGRPGISDAAHLGGMFFGYLFLRGNKTFLRLRDRYYREKLKRLRRKYRVVDGGKSESGRGPYVH